MDDYHYQIIEWFIRLGETQKETYLKETIHNGWIYGISDSSTDKILHTMYAYKLLSIKDGNISLTDIGKLHYENEKKKRDFDKDVINTQKSLNKSQIRTNWLLFAVAFASLMVSLVSTCNDIKCCITK